MKIYELVIILDGKTTAAKAKAFTEKMEKTVEFFKGKLALVEEWGKKDLKTPIKKIDTGYYLVYSLDMDGNFVKALNDKLRLDDEVLRFVILLK